jgi:hypothetical protein
MEVRDNINFNMQKMNLFTLEPKIAALQKYFLIALDNARE